MRFIGDHHLLGVVQNEHHGPGEVVLWDATILGDTRIPRQLVFDLGSQYKTLNSSPSGAIVHDEESSYGVPFRTDPSTRLVGIKVAGDYIGGVRSQRLSKVLLIRAQALFGFTSRIGTTSTIRWEDWLHLTKPIRIKGLSSSKVHLQHSNLVCLRRSTSQDAPILSIFDFSLERKMSEGDSGEIGEYSEHLIPFSGEISKSDPHLLTSNIVFQPGSVDDSVGSTLLGAQLASSGSTQPH